MTTYKIDKRRARLKGRVSLGEKSKPGMALIPEEIMNSPAYLRLPIPARHLLTEISTQYRPGNNGNLCLAYEPIFKPRGWKRTTYYELKDTLADAGFIVMTQKGGNRHAGYCALAWRDIDPPLPKVGSYDPGITIGSRPSKPWVKSIADIPSLEKKLTVADEAITSGSKKRGAATRHVDSETCRHTTRSLPIEAVNVPPHDTREPNQPSETCRQPAPSKNLCHGQTVSVAQGIWQGEHEEVESESAHIAEAKAVCPVLAPDSNVIPLTVSGYYRRPQTAATAQAPAASSVIRLADHAKGLKGKTERLKAKLTEIRATAELEAVTAEFRELLIVGGITPEKADARIRESAAHGEFGAVQFMRQFITRHGEAIREERQAARTSGAIAAAVRWFKPARLAA